MNSIISPRSKYEILPNEEESPTEISPNAPLASNNRKLSWIIFFLALLSAWSLGFISGRISWRALDVTMLLKPSGDQTEIWRYNRNFSQAPDDESNAAWRSIFPKGRGFIHHPKIAPNISGIAVFHELHCLNGLRHAYYDALSKCSQEGHTVPAAELSERQHENGGTNSHHDDPTHIRHCFDYLRHALMCAADTNLEVVDWRYNGVTGWGFERKCRNYQGVLNWAERWKTHNQTDIS